MKVKRGDIIWLKKECLFSFLGKNVQFSNRPYIVLSNNENNNKCPTINIAAITKQVNKANYPMHVFIDKDKYRLKYDSVILLEQVLTINKSLVKDIKASLDEEDMLKFNRAVYIQMIDETLNTAII